MFATKPVDGLLTPRSLDSAYLHSLMRPDLKGSICFSSALRRFL